MDHFLTIPEEIILLSVGENGGEVPQGKNYEVVLAASILMDLAIHNRIDSDLEKIIPVTNKPTKDVVLDDTMEMIFPDKTPRQPSYWISQVALRFEEYSETMVASLITKKVLKVENQKLLWFFSKRKYPVIDNKEMKEVKVRIRELVFSNDIPDIRDIVIVSLLNYGGLLPLVFTEFEIEKYKLRIEQIAKMDLIGQAIAAALHEFAGVTLAIIAKQLLGVKTPEDKLEALVKEMKTKFRLEDKDLPDWLKKGTTQYIKTLDYIRKTGRSDIYYNRKKDEYCFRQYYYFSHVFGSGS